MEREALHTLAVADVVEEWKRAVRARLAKQHRSAARTSCLRALITKLSEKLDRRSGVQEMVVQARSELARGQVDNAASIAWRALELACSPAARRTLAELMAWAAIAQQDPFLAHSSLMALPEEAIEPYLLASYLRCCNRSDEALELLQEVRKAGQRTRETTKLLIDLAFLRRDYEAVRTLATEDAALLSSADRQAIASALPRS
ncbi:MAG TPA: hypothetical protein VM686_13325 [Polyangiaceae bacterium]|jgi:hypothetical protein|nr:hypothetical protein [Polyangiaceae bacterium]